MSSRTTALIPSELKSAIVLDPLVVSPDATVMDAIAQMSGVRSHCSIANTAGHLDGAHLEARSSCVLVVEDRGVVGILTERDVVRLSAQQQPLDRLSIRQVMVSPVITLYEAAFTDLFRTINLLQHHRIRHLPIMDRQDRLLGLVTYESLQQSSRAIDLLRLRQVEDVMTSEVVCASPNSQLLEIAQLMATHQVSSVVVVEPSDSNDDALQIPIGILTERDLVQFQALGLTLESCQAQVVMSSPTFAISPEESLFAVQQLMERHFIRRLVVTGKHGELLGIVTQSSVLQILNPLELYKLAEGLGQKVVRLEADNVALLESRAAELEREVDVRTAALKIKVEREKLLAELATQIRSSLSLRSILDTTVEKVRQVLNCDRVNIWRFEANWQSIAVAESTDSPLSLIGERVNDTCFNQNMAELYRQGRIHVVSDIDKANLSVCHREMLIRLHTRAKIVTPLMCGDRLWGLLNVTESDGPRDWEADDVDLLQALSVQLAIAIQQATTYQQLTVELRARQQAQASQRESEQRYVSLAAAVPVVIFRTDTEGLCTYVNSRWSQLTGLSPEATIGKQWKDIVYCDERSSVDAEWAKSIRENSLFQMEFCIQRPDGSMSWVYGQVVVERDGRGQAIGYVGTLTDITDRKQTEAALQNLIAGTAATTGEDFFPALVSHIASALDISYAVVTEKNDDSLNTLAFWANGALQPNATYHSKNTPCDCSLEAGSFFCERSVQEQFPKLSNWLESAESYLGIALHDTQGSTIGNLCILDKEPIRNPQRAEQILRVFAARAAAELERQRTTVSLEQLNQELEVIVACRTSDLKKRELHYRALMDGAGDAIILTNRYGSILEVNHRAEVMLGYHRDELTSMHVSALHRPEDLSKVMPAYEQVTNQQLSQMLDVGFRNKYGQIIPVDVSASVIEIQGEKIVQAILRDITERKKAEKAIYGSRKFLQTVLDTFPLSVFWKDLNSVYLGCNRNFLRDVGLTSIEDIVGKTDYDMPWGEEEADVYRADDRQVMDSGTAKLETIETQIQADGNLLWLETNKLPLRNLKGEVIGVMGTNRDISARKYAEEQLQRTNEELARATRLKDEFLANMSHELRTPLNAILGMSEGLQEEAFGQINTAQINALRTIERSGNHLLELINDILDVAKIESGQIELDLESTEIEPLCQSSLPFIKQQAQKKRIQLEVVLPLNLPNLAIDQRRMRQVLINLLNNAVKFTPEGGHITLTASVQQSIAGLDSTISPPHHCVRLSVKDTGIGIPAEHMNQLFQPFIQIDSALNRQYQGTGLGLALVKRIVELHGGQVGLSSQVGVGSCFTIDLPYTPLPASTKTAIPKESSADLPAINLSNTSPLVLLAEDNDANIRTVSSYLKAKGYQITLARNGREAIAKARSDNPDVILMDIQMPEIDGLEAMQELRSPPDSIQTPIIALTALAMKGDRERCLAAGATDYLSKPVKLNELANTIQKLLVHQEITK
ncbi:MAG: PAS domain S-box protein [Cyanobacteria bacterium P01_A01_bin.3]